MQTKSKRHGSPGRQPSRQTVVNRKKIYSVVLTGDEDLSTLQVAERAGVDKYTALTVLRYLERKGGIRRRQYRTKTGTPGQSPIMWCRQHRLCEVLNNE